MAIALPPTLTFHSLSLPHKPNAPIRYAFVPSTTPTPSPYLLVFLNGLGLPQSAWHPVIAHLVRARPIHPPLLTYDRYGQGQTTARDPADTNQPPSTTHDATTIIHDLHALLAQIRSRHALSSPRLLLIASSIGAPLARLYAAAHPRAVAALTLLDSNIANTDFVSIFPDPDGPTFDPATLPAAVTPAALRHTRAAFARRFHPAVPNAERFNRRTLPALLPDAGAPRLVGPDGGGPLLTVVGHDPLVFAREGEEGSMGTPAAVTMAYTEPAWARYHAEMMGVTEAERGRGPLVAVGAGHFVQRDVPEFVARVVGEQVEAVEATFGAG